jgi:hypothetical protein
MIIGIILLTVWLILSGYLFYLVKTDIYRFCKVEQISTLAVIWFILLIVICIFCF